MANSEGRYWAFGLASITVLAAASSAYAQTAAPPPVVVVTASRLNLLGKASTASQGSVTQQEVELRPIYRVGQLYETVPGLVVTVHSGEGKASQYLLRGFNLDHGTDFASFIDAMPVNRPTNAHGQGYSDQNFLMPQLVGGLDYTKGPYYAAIGDFGAVGSARVRLSDDLPDQLSASVGTLRDADLFASVARRFDADDRLWIAADVGQLDGPWDPPGDFNKATAAARFSHGDEADGFSLTGMAYQSAGRMETDQSVTAIQQGLIGRFGTLDPSDASRSQRYSLSGHYGAEGPGWAFTSDAYAIHSTMTLWNDFTHFLFDPVNGDQEEQDEVRDTRGGDAALTLEDNVGAIRGGTTFGLQERYDSVFVDRRHTRDRTILDYCELANVAGTAARPYAAVGGYCSADQVGLSDLGAYVQNTTHWTGWLRTVIGFREEDYQASDHSLTLGVRGSASQTLPQPKASLILGPWAQTEFYFSAGRGFHSDDVRGVFQTVPLEGISNAGVKTPLMAPATGEELGLRSNTIPRVALQLAVFQEDFSSELAYDQDQGEDQASAPSRRQGVEVSAQYRPLPWVELNTDLAFSRARYRDSVAVLQNEFGLGGPFIANAPSFIGSFGVLVDNLGSWFGGTQWRALGAYPVNDGARYPQARGYSEINLDLGYKLSGRMKLQLSLYNVLNSKADAAAYDYTDRLTASGVLPSGATSTVTGLQVHPLEPRSVRLTLTATL